LFESILACIVAGEAEWYNKMSDPMTNSEVEDILSSIRRLVSEESRNDIPRRVPDAVPSDRLVLTPALRVETPGVESQTEAFGIFDTEPSPAKSGDPDADDIEAAVARHAGPLENGTAMVEDDLPTKVTETLAEPYPGVPELPAYLADAPPVRPHIQAEADELEFQDEAREVAEEPDDVTGSAGDTEIEMADRLGWALRARTRATNIQTGQDVTESQLADEITPTEADSGVEHALLDDTTPVGLDKAEDDPRQKVTFYPDEMVDEDGIALHEALTPEAVESESDVSTPVEDGPEPQAQTAPVPDPESDSELESVHRKGRFSWTSVRTSEPLEQDLAGETDSVEEDAVESTDDIDAAPFMHVEDPFDDDASAAQWDLDAQPASDDEPEHAKVPAGPDLSPKIPSLGDKIAALEALVARDAVQEFEPDTKERHENAAEQQPSVDWAEVEPEAEALQLEESEATARETQLDADWVSTETAREVEAALDADAVPEIEASVENEASEDVVETEQTDDRSFEEMLSEEVGLSHPDTSEMTAEPENDAAEMTVQTQPEVQAQAWVDAGHDDTALSEALDEEEGLLDEETLRTLVSDIVREELQGALGERITRNVRKLVRREIHRALAAQDLD
jgi:hypothetical protein